MCFSFSLIYHGKQHQFPYSKMQSECLKYGNKEQNNGQLLRHGQRELLCNSNSKTLAMKKLSEKNIEFNE